MQGIAVIGILFLIVSAFLFFSFFKPGPGNTNNGKVYIKKEGKKHTLIRNGEPFFIQGGSGYAHIGELASIGGNTIRTWDTTNLQSILDEAEKHNVAVIVGLGMLHSKFNDFFYSDLKKVSNQYSAFQNVVTKYKDHPALLMWCLGNELDFHLKFGYKEFYAAYRNLIKMIRDTDPDHPITTTFCSRGRQDFASFRFFNIDLDVISMNRFGNIAMLSEELENDSWLWDWPIIVTEWGINGPWEKNSTSWRAPIEDFDSVKAERIEYIYKNYFPRDNPRFLGSLVFYWGQKQERTHTWFSLFDEEGNTSRSFEKVQYLFSNTVKKNRAPYVTEMRINGMEAKDDAIFLPGAEVEAMVKVKDPDGDTLIYKWEILKEQWYFNDRVINHKPESYNHLIRSSKNSKATFAAPLENGPYRVFVHVSDNKGNFGSANVPFYILE